MGEFIFTFGCGQKHAGHFVRIRADGYEQARAEMFERFGEEWAFGYTLEQ